MGINILDILLVAIFVFNLTIGLLKGFLRKAFEVISFIFGVVAAYVYYKSGGSVFKVTLVFILANCVARVVFWGIRKILCKEPVGPSFFSRIAGAVIGAAEGALYALVMLICIDFLGGTLAADNSAFAKTLETSRFYSRYKELRRNFKVPGVKETSALGELLQGRHKNVVLGPEAVSKLRDTPSIKAIMEDKELLESIQKKEYGKILSNPKFIKLLSDKELMKQLMAPGLYQIQDFSNSSQDTGRGSR